MAKAGRILLIIGGGIAAYKSLFLIRELMKHGHQVRGLLTAAGAQFITPLSVASITKDHCYTDLFSLTDEAEMGHIELSREADLLVLAPATADLLAKMAHGMANDLASTVLLATNKPVLIAPAMNVRMWLHPATKRNLAQLKQDGIFCVGPDSGEMACGEFGEGRMAEPEAIIEAIEAHLSSSASSALLTPKEMTEPILASSVMGVEESSLIHSPVFSSAKAFPTKKEGPLRGKRILVTSGPTYEPIDPVRYIANRSSGKQGHAIAKAAAAAGAEVILISGPVALPDPEFVHVIHVENAREMLKAVEASLPADIGIFAAAVADWRVATAAKEKLKKGSNGPPALALAENPDILASIGKGKKRPTLLIGFAAGTHRLLENARIKLKKKGCDLIIANDVSLEGSGLNSDYNQIHLVDEEHVESWPLLSKEEIAERLIKKLAQNFSEDE